MAAAGRDLLEGQLSNGCGKVDRDGAEADADRSVRLLDLVHGEPGDRRGPLGVEEQQQAGETVFGLEGVIVQQAAGGVPAGFVVHGLGGATPSFGREGEIASDLLGEGPAHEVACLLAVADVVAGHPALKVGLLASGKGQVLVRKPVQDVDGCPQMLPRDLELVVRGLLAAAASAKPAQEVPGCVPVQDFPSFGGRVGGDEVLHVPFETDHLLIAFRQGARGDEDAADVFDDLSFGEFVQGFVGKGAAVGAEVGQDGGDDALGQPAHRGASPFGAGHGLVEGPQFRRYGAGVSGEEVVEPLLEGAAGVRARRVQPFGLSAGGAWAPELGVRFGAGAADGGVGGAGVDAAESSADGAVSRASVAAAAAGQPGELRERAGCGAAADRAEQCGQGTAVRADRPLCGAGTDHT